MDLRRLKRHWNQLGRKDPLYAVLSWPGKEAGHWDREEFFRTGVEEVDGVLHELRDLRVDLRTRSALDFGCGVGRLTQALAEHFDEVVGIDIAASMIESARAHNRYPDRCTYVLSDTGDLRAFEDDRFDFVYSNITLQHMEPVYSRRYLHEFVRVLAPGGTTVFNLPSEPLPSFRGNVPRPEKPRAWPSRGLQTALRTVAPPLWWWIQVRRNPWMETHGTPRPEVISLLQEAGARIVDVTEDRWAPHWVGYRYCATKSN